MSCSQGQRPAQARVQNKTLQTLSSQERMSISPPQNCSQPPYVLVPAVRIAPMATVEMGNHLWTQPKDGQRRARP
jgi:hypothetical protein